VRLRTLGPDGPTVTAIGCGDVSLGIAAARGIDKSEVERALHEAIELGITFVDVHDEQDAERMAGNAMRTFRVRDRLVIATRVPVIAERPGAPRRDVLPERLPARYVQECVEASLRATKLEALPLVQLPVHPAWRASSAWPELAGMCARLVREGNVMRWGLIVDELADAVPLASEPWLSAIAVTYNLCDRGAEPLIAAAIEHKLAVLARRPLAGGVLAGRLGPGVRLTPRDDRHVHDEAALERFAVIAAKLSPLVRHEPPAARSSDAARAVLERGRRPPELECNTVAELALRAVIDRGLIALPRLHRREYLIDALVAIAAPPLSGDLQARILDANLDATT
jgi:aryl-alcohol dehydrogenase-like predicted oxidoreductase